MFLNIHVVSCKLLELNSCLMSPQHLGQLPVFLSLLKDSFFDLRAGELGVKGV
jgi:hypothetical protein